MEVTTVEVMDHKTGLVTQGITPQLDAQLAVIHQKFLDTHRLASWQLVIQRVFGTPDLLIFSRPSGSDETPNYKLGDLEGLADEITETLETHYQQWSSRLLPKDPTLGAA
jgi:hypothetical protein